MLTLYPESGHNDGVCLLEVYSGVSDTLANGDQQDFFAICWAQGMEGRKGALRVTGIVAEPVAEGGHGEGA